MTETDSTLGQNLAIAMVAVLVGPLFFILAREGGSVFALFLFCIVVIPLLTLVSTQKWKLLTWQIAAVSFSLAMFVQNFNSSEVNDALPIAVRFWVVISVFSSPLPIYFLLKQLTPRNRIIFGIVVAALIVTFLLNFRRILV